MGEFSFDQVVPVPLKKQGYLQHGVGAVYGLVGGEHLERPKDCGPRAVRQKETWDLALRAVLDLYVGTMPKYKPCNTKNMEVTGCNRVPGVSTEKRGGEMKSARGKIRDDPVGRGARPR